MFFAEPALWFITDFPAEETIQYASENGYDSFQRFMVDPSSIPLPVRMGSKVKVVVDSMRVVYTESSRPSTAKISSVEFVGNQYETIGEHIQLPNS